jgi:pimeloyl-ACP methyl ester carboxylesterase
MKKALSIMVLLIVLGAGAFVLAARSGWLTPSDTTLRARYQLPTSTFIEIDGEPIHVVDEGTGDAIVLVHGSYANLRQWNEWAKTLTGRYRVIRFDQPPMGLSGPDPRGLYDAKRQVRVIAGVMEALKIERAFLVATSSGGVAGTQFAAAYPERLSGLILNNIGVKMGPADRSALPPLFKMLLTVEPWFNGWHSQAYWRQVLQMNMVNTAKITPGMVQEWADLNNRAQRMPRSAANENMVAAMNRTPEVLPTITAPTLVLWSDTDHDTPLETQGKLALELLGAADKSLQVVPQCGHMMPMDCGAESAAVALAFFDRVTAAGTTGAMRQATPATP